MLKTAVLSLIPTAALCLQRKQPALSGAMTLRTAPLVLVTCEAGFRALLEFAKLTHTAYFSAARSPRIYTPTHTHTHRGRAAMVDEQEVVWLKQCSEH